MLLKLKRFFKSINRSWQYAKFGWSQVDYDYSSVYRGIAFTLTRIRPHIEHGYHQDNKELLKRLDTMVLLAKRLEDPWKYYGLKNHELLKKRFGPNSHISIPTSNPNLFRWESTNPKRQTKEYEVVFKHIMELEKNINENDKKLFSKYLIKYLERLWD